MTDLKKFKGIFTALNVIYDENDNVDLEKIKQLVNVYKSKGVKGIYACGSTGEGFLLSTQERKDVAKAIVEAANGEMTVIVHVGSASTKESVELAKHCEEIGADAVSAVPCVYYHLPEESVELHWNTIIESTSLPFIIYNIPQLTAFNLSPQLLAKMADRPLRSARPTRCCTRSRRCKRLPTTIADPRSFDRGFFVKEPSAAHFVGSKSYSIRNLPASGSGKFPV